MIVYNMDSKAGGESNVYRLEQIYFNRLLMDVFTWVCGVILVRRGVLGVFCQSPGHSTSNIIVFGVGPASDLVSINGQGQQAVEQLLALKA